MGVTWVKKAVGAPGRPRWDNSSGGGVGGCSGQRGGGRPGLSMVRVRLSPFAEPAAGSKATPEGEGAG